MAPHNLDLVISLRVFEAALADYAVVPADGTVVALQQQSQPRVVRDWRASSG